MVQSLSELTFLLNLFCSYTILEDLTEQSFMEKSINDYSKNTELFQLRQTGREQGNREGAGSGVGRIDVMVERMTAHAQ